MRGRRTIPADQQVYCGRCDSWLPALSFSEKQLYKKSKTPRICAKCFSHINARVDVIRWRQPIGSRHSRPEDVKGIVYFIRGIGGVGPIKIGFTSSLNRRLQSLQCDSPLILEVLAQVEATPVLEYELHKRFTRHRSHNEWYHPAPELLEFIEKVKQQEAI